MNQMIITMPIQIWPRGNGLCDHECDETYLIAAEAKSQGEVADKEAKHRSFPASQS